MRIGVGRPDSTDPEIVSAHVLGAFREPKADVAELIDRATSTRPRRSCSASASPDPAAAVARALCRWVSMGTRSRIAIVLAAGAGMLAGAAPASAVSPPSCWNAERVGASRHAAGPSSCTARATSTPTVAAARTSSQLELLRSDGELLELRLTPDRDGPRARRASRCT